MIQSKGKDIEGTIKQPLMNTAMWSRYPFSMVVMAAHLLTITTVASVEIQKYLVLNLFCQGKTDGHLSRFCSQMQSLADHGPDNNMLYPHGPSPFVNSYSHEQDMQAVAHHVEKGTDPVFKHLLNLIG